MRPGSTAMMSWLVVLGIVAATLPQAAVSAPNADPFSVRSDVAYGPWPAERGDLFLPPANGQLRSAVLVIHGGGWISGQRSTNAWLSGLIARKGMVVFNIDYRLGVAGRPETHWPAQLVDAQLAVRWLRAHAKELQIDSDRIGAVGDSAGGTLAVFLGVLEHPVRGDQSDLLADQRSDVRAVVDQFGVMDLGALGASASAMAEGIFGTKAPGGDLLQSVSPLPFVTPGSAAMLLMHGDKDEFAPLQQSRQLVQALEAHGVRVQLIVFRGGHGFEGVSPPHLLALFNRDVEWLDQALNH